MGNPVKETVYTILAKGLSEKGQTEGLWFAGHIEALYLSFKSYVEEIEKVDCSPMEIAYALPLNMPDVMRVNAIRQALEIKKDITRVNNRRLAALEGLLKDFDNLTEQQKEDAYNSLS